MSKTFETDKQWNTVLFTLSLPHNFLLFEFFGGKSRENWPERKWKEGKEVNHFMLEMFEKAASGHLESLPEAD